MPIQLFSNEQALLTQLAPPRDDMLIALLTVGESALLPPVQDALASDFSSEVIDQILEIDIGGPRLSRLNFDVVQQAIIDLPLDVLTGSAGRRLLDALGRLAKEELTIAFVGEPMSVIGAFLLDGATAGLNLLPRTVVVPDVQAVPDLRALLATLAQRRLRLLALDGDVAATYDHASDRVTVSGDEDAAGNVLLTAFVAGEEGQPTARVQMLQPGVTSGWPEI